MAPLQGKKAALQHFSTSACQHFSLSALQENRERGTYKKTLKARALLQGLIFLTGADKLKC